MFDNLNFGKFNILKIKENENIIYCFILIYLNIIYIFLIISSFKINFLSKRKKCLLIIIKKTFFVNFLFYFFKKSLI